MKGLDGVAVVNVVTNPDEAAVNGRKKLQTRITHNDGGSWKPMAPPAKDSLGQPYGCSNTVGTVFPIACGHRRPTEVTSSCTSRPARSRYMAIPPGVTPRPPTVRLLRQA